MKFLSQFARSTNILTYFLLFIIIFSVIFIVMFIVIYLWNKFMSVFCPAHYQLWINWAHFAKQIAPYYRLFISLVSHIHTHTHTLTHTHTHTHIFTHTFTHIHIYRHTQIGIIILYIFMHNCLQIYQNKFEIKNWRPTY